MTNKELQRYEKLFKKARNTGINNAEKSEINYLAKLKIIHIKNQKDERPK